jgi:hypothetical protein
MPNADFDPSENPYRSPAATDDGDGNAARGRQKRARDLALVGMFLGTCYGAATGAAITVSLAGVHTFVELATEAEAISVSGRADEWITYYVAVAALGALLGALSGAILGHVQGWVTARKPSASPRRLQGGAAFSWATIAAIWCLLIDQNMLASAPRTWILYLALLVAPTAAVLAGVMVASRLAMTASMR